MSIITNKSSRQAKIITKRTSRSHFTNFIHRIKINIRLFKTFTEVANKIFIVLPKSTNRVTIPRDTGFHTCLNRKHHRHKLQAKTGIHTEGSLSGYKVAEDRGDTTNLRSQIVSMRPIKVIYLDIIVRV